VRINNVGPQVVVPPEVRGPVDEVRATRPVNAQGAAAYSGARILVETTGALPTQAVIHERRATPRRSDERRKRQLPVLIDTRVGERRTVRRRADDEPAPSIDVEA
jgi:hypothetical protein